MFDAVWILTGFLDVFCSKSEEKEILVRSKIVSECFSGKKWKVAFYGVFILSEALLAHAQGHEKKHEEGKK